MNSLNMQNKDGDLPLHILFRKSTKHDEYKVYLHLFKSMLKMGSSVHIKNIYGRTLLHECVKYSLLGVEAIKFLLQNGACMNSVDNKGSSILHDVFRNPFVNMDMVKLLLKNGAYPDSRDNENRPPLAYVSTSNLSIKDKSSATNLLITNTIIAKFNIFKKQGNDSPSMPKYDSPISAQLKFKEQLTEGDDILCLDFCRGDTAIHDRLAKIRDDCLAEMKELDNYGLHANLFECCQNVDVNSVKNLNLIGIFDGLSRGKYPYFQDLIISVIKHCDIDNILKKNPIFAFKSIPSDTADAAVVLNNHCVLSIALYMSKIDLVNLIIAFWVESIDTETM